MDTLVALAEPFPASEVEFRAGATNDGNTRAMALAYITSRATMKRLDDVVGPANWKDAYSPGPLGGVLCSLSLRINDEWITKQDGADNTAFEPVKGGISDAFKRACVKWGIGRYLYYLPSVWVKCEKRGKTVLLVEIPELPEWALPGGSGIPDEVTQMVKRVPKAPTSATTTALSPADANIAQMVAHMRELTREAPYNVGPTQFWQLANAVGVEKVAHAMSINAGDEPESRKLMMEWVEKEMRGRWADATIWLLEHINGEA